MGSGKIIHIDVCTTGGDSPRMNSALYRIVMVAEQYGFGVSGIRKGYEGMIEGDFIPLESQQFLNMVHYVKNKYKQTGLK